jgi:hypothetical protein
MYIYITMASSNSSTYISYVTTDDNGQTFYVKYNFLQDDGKVYIRHSCNDEWVEAENESIAQLCKETIQMAIA